MLSTAGTGHTLRITAKVRHSELAWDGGAIVTAKNIANSQGNTWATGRFVSQNTRSAVNKTLSSTALGVRDLTGGAGHDVLLIDANDALSDGAIPGVSQNTAATVRHDHNGDTAQLWAKTKLWSNHRDGNSVASRRSMKAQTQGQQRVGTSSCPNPSTRVVSRHCDWPQNLGLHQANITHVSPSKITQNERH